MPSRLTPPPAACQVAILCNHQRAVGRAHGDQMTKLQDVLKAMNDELEALEKEHKDAKKEKKDTQR